MGLSKRSSVLGGLILFLCLQGGSVWAQSSQDPFLGERGITSPKEIDTLIAKTLRRRDLEPAAISSDAVFIRRVYLDVIGTLPEPYEVRRFLENKSKRKRHELIDQLLKHEAYADYWALKWCDILRVKAEFPINLWPNAVQAYHRWILEALRENMPYDEFARELLTASGSNFRVPQVNFYRAVQGQEPSTLAAAVALTFMGTRVDAWSAEQRQGLEVFFSRLAFKGTAEWKEEIVYLDPTPVDGVRAILPDWSSVRIEPGQDPRIVFADWLIHAKNPWFAKNYVNRLWASLFGRGIIHEPDDIRNDNRPVHPDVLTYLEKELVRSGWDTHHVLRLILNSQTYQQSSIPKGDPKKSEIYFACYPVRRLEAEVLIDALCWVSGTRERYESPIPEPFTFIPEEHRSIALADGSITSQFLEMFGRPSRDTGLVSERNNEPTDAQRLYMLNSSQIQSKIEQSWRLNNIMRTAKNQNRPMIRQIYLTILSRYPTDEEIKVAENYFTTKKLGKKQALQDVAWALINSKEFLYRH